jgi:hypothetical protein
MDSAGRLRRSTRLHRAPTIPSRPDGRP